MKWQTGERRGHRPVSTDTGIPQSLTREGELVLRYKKEPRRHRAKWNNLATHTTHCMTPSAYPEQPHLQKQMAVMRKMGTRWIRTSFNSASSKSSRDLFYSWHSWTVFEMSKTTVRTKSQDKTNTLHGVVLPFIYKLYPLAWETSCDTQQRLNEDIWT